MIGANWRTFPVSALDKLRAGPSRLLFHVARRIGIPDGSAADWQDRQSLNVLDSDSE